MAAKHFSVYHPSWGDRIDAHAATVAGGMIEDNWSLDDAIEKGFVFTPLVAMTAARVEALRVALEALTHRRAVAKVYLSWPEAEEGARKNMELINAAHTELTAMLADALGGEG